MRRRYALLLIAVTVCVGCPREEPLTDQQRELNLESFDYVWTTVRDKHYDPELGGLDWQQLYDELRPRVAEATTMSEARAPMQELIRSLGQSHFAIIPDEVYEALGPPEPRDAGTAGDEDPEAAYDGTTGIDVRVVDGAALVVRVDTGSSADEAGVKPGWVISRIGEEEIAPLLAKLEKALRERERAPREAVLSGSVNGRLGGRVGEDVTIEFLDGAGQSQERVLSRTKSRGWKRQFGHLPPIHIWIDVERLDGDVGYIAFNSFLDPIDVMPVFNEAMKSFSDASGVIVDIRGNGGGLPTMVTGMIGWMIEEKNRHIGTMYLRDVELELVVNPRRPTFVGPVAVLVDGLSGSASEFFAGGLQDLGRACIVGSQTMGAALPSAVEKLPNGDGFQYVFANYLSAGGESLEGAGVTPDIEVLPSREALLAGNDAVLAAAMAWIREQHGTGHGG